MDRYIGATIDNKYHLQSLLGEGGNGCVYKAEQPELSRSVAIKILHNAAAMDQDARSRFDREARILASLKHENILQVLSIGLLPDGTPYMVMEFLQGRTLSEELTGPLPWRRVAHIGKQACAAVAAAHKEAIIHRDLKPENIMLTDFPTPDSVKVLDFGLSKLIESTAAQKLTETGALIGSVHYMSPEVCTGQKATAQSDIYSLGCVLYEALSGRTPFECESPIGMLHKHRTELPTKLKNLPACVDLPGELELVVFKALQKEPANRFESMDAFGQALERVLAGETNDLHLANVRMSTSSPDRKFGSIAIGALAFALIAGIAIARVSKPALPKENSATLAAQRTAAIQTKIDTELKKEKQDRYILATTYCDLGQQLANVNDLAGAREAYRKSLDAAPERSLHLRPKALLGFSNCIVKAKDESRYGEAQKAYDQAISITDAFLAEPSAQDIYAIQHGMQARAGKGALYIQMHNLPAAREAIESGAPLWHKMNNDSRYRAQTMGMAGGWGADTILFNLEIMKAVAKVESVQDSLDLAAIYLKGAEYVIESGEAQRASPVLACAKSVLDSAGDKSTKEWADLSARCEQLSLLTRKPPIEAATALRHLVAHGELR